MSRHGYPRARRVTRGRELEAVRREGKRVRTEHVEVRVLASLSSYRGVPPVLVASVGARVGIIVPKHRHSGVERNLVKRRLRELVRLRLLPALPAAAAQAAIVLRARPEAYGATYEALGRDVDRAAREAVRLLRATSDTAASAVADATVPIDVAPADVSDAPRSV